MRFPRACAARSQSVSSGTLEKLRSNRPHLPRATTKRESRRQQLARASASWCKWTRLARRSGSPLASVAVAIASPNEQRAAPSEGVHVRDAIFPLVRLAFRRGATTACAGGRVRNESLRRRARS